MVYYRCDICGKELPKKSLRYIVKIDLYAAYDTLEITKDDLKKDYLTEIRELLEKMKDMDPKKLEEDVFMNFKYDLCKQCKDKYAQNPLDITIRV